MSLRSDREDYSDQQDAIVAARSHLRLALGDLASEAALAAKKIGQKRGTPDLPAVYGAVSVVRRAEEALDLATLDLATARGEDA